MDEKLKKAAEDRAMGWLVRAIADSFAYLVSDFDYRVDRVKLHHEGSYVLYSTPGVRVVIEWEPAGRDLSVLIQVPTEIPIAVWAVLGTPGVDWSAPPRNRRLSQDAAVGLVHLWAEGLRRYAEDVLKGSRPSTISS